MEVRQTLGGRYQLLSRLGTGGMAVVWRAQDEVLGRLVAVKLLAGRFADDPQSRSRIRDEARAAAALSHPHIAQVYDYGESTENGTPVPYVVMELINGPTLQQRVADGPLPARTVFRICGEVAAGLAAAHADGLVHRDIKMANIMVTAAGAKVVDFGIAAAVGPAEPGELLVGTPAYLAPERLAGAPVQPASDVYALGVLLFRLLADQPPWSVESTTQMLKAHVHLEPDPLPDRPGVPPAVADLVARCLRKDPASRPTAAAVSSALADAAEASSALADAAEPSVTPAGASPTPAGALPASAGASPTLAGAAPAPAGASPTPAGASPGSAGASPGSAGASPGSAGASPGSAGASPGSAGASPGSAGASPAFAGAAESSPTDRISGGRDAPRAWMPRPADSRGEALAAGPRAGRRRSTEDAPSLDAPTGSFRAAAQPAPRSAASPDSGRCAPRQTSGDPADHPAGWAVGDMRPMSDHAAGLPGGSMEWGSDDAPGPVGHAAEPRGDAAGWESDDAAGPAGGMAGPDSWADGPRPVRSGPPGAVVGGDSSVRRRKRKLLLAGGVAVALIGAGLAGWISSGDAEVLERGQAAVLPPPSVVAPARSGVSVAPRASAPAGADGRPATRGPGHSADAARSPAPAKSRAKSAGPVVVPTSPARVTTPTPTVTVSTSPTASPPPAGSRLTSPGGLVYAECGSGGAALSGWEPAPGFDVEDVDAGPALAAEIVFADGLERYRMTVTCVAGVPTPVVLPL